MGYIEAWYVDEHIRGQKLGKELVYAAEGWAREKGCAEMASDTWLENEASIAAHLRLGYQEAERLGAFCKTVIRPQTLGHGVLMVSVSTYRS